MATIHVNTTIRDLLSFYREERRIFGRCPHCGEVFRLAEAKLTYGKEPPRDLLSRLKGERDTLEAQVAKLNQEIEELEADHEDEMDNLDQGWRERVDVEVQRHLLKKTKEIRQQAIARSRVTTLGKVIERIAPMFTGFGHHPADVRPVFEPIDFVIFEGLFTGEVTDVVFCEFKTGGSQLTSIQRSIRQAIDRKRIHFEERRMTADVLRRLAHGGRFAPGLPAIEMRKPK